MSEIDTTRDGADDVPRESMDQARIFEPWWFAVIALIFIALWLWREVGIRAGREDAQSQQAEINRLRHENELLTQQLERVSGELAGLASSRVQTMALGGQQQAPGASAKVFLDPKEKRAMAFFYNLPPTPPGTQYRVWVQSGDGPAVEAGNFVMTRSGRASLAMDNVPEGPRFVVTRGGADAPPYLRSK